MAFGLGKNSPIVLSLGKSNYEALISRHGQFVRWRSARKCTCVTTANEPDVHCPKCGGSGEVYDCQREYEDTLRVPVRGGVFELPADIADCEIQKIWNAAGTEFEFEKTGPFVTVDGPLFRGEFVDVLYRAALVSHIEQVALERVGGGFYRVPGVESEMRKIEGIFCKAPGDVLEAERVFGADGQEVEVVGYRQDCIQIESDEEALTAFGISWLKPFVFVVLSQNLTEADTSLVRAHNGDAVCTFPYMYDVSEGDVITVLSGAMTAKIALAHRGGAANDVLPEFFVSEVGSVETKDSEFRAGADFVLAGTNRLHWTGDRPEAGAVMSVVYEYNPTYRVCKEIPNLRTSEDQRIPRKVVLKLFSAFAEGKRVNRNG